MNLSKESGTYALSGTLDDRCLIQVGTLIEKTCNLKLDYQSKSFFNVEMKNSPKGIKEVHGAINDDGSILTVNFMLTPKIQGGRVDAAALLNKMAELGDKFRTVKAPEGKAEGIWVQANISAKAPMGYARQQVFKSELSALNQLAEELGEVMPENLPDNEQLQALYKKIEGLDAVELIAGGTEYLPPEVKDFAVKTLAYIHGGNSVAIETGYIIMDMYILSAIASCAVNNNMNLGKLNVPMANARMLAEVAVQAPGIVSVPAGIVNLASNSYEVGNEMSGLMNILASSGKAMLFYGTQSQLQGVFAGGQGGENNPLSPVVVHAPKVSLDKLAHFSVAAISKKIGGISKNDHRMLTGAILQGLAPFSKEAQDKVLLQVTNHCTRAYDQNRDIDSEFVMNYAKTLLNCRETLAGLNGHGRIGRTNEVQTNWVEELANPGLFNYFRSEIFAQDLALRKLCDRLCMEVLTKPIHLPVAYCAQGTPGTGKSESSIMLSRRLGIPHINIDAASMPDSYTASAQLLGSGRGIVGSYQAGRLEQAAKCHTGAVVEISDLDHAPQQVRSVLGDLFLQVLSTGEAQSAKGAMFSCANLIFAFTVNLPGGQDESVRKSIGYNRETSRAQLERDVTKQLKQMLSSAFISRIGTPILFDPLDDDVSIVIIENAMRKAVASAAERCGFKQIDISMDLNTARQAHKTLSADTVSGGARVIIEHGRALAAQAFTEVIDKLRTMKFQGLHIRWAENKLMIEAVIEAA